MNSKKLHKHALPVVLMSIGGFLIAASLSALATSTMTSRYSKALTTRPFSIRSTSATSAELVTRNAGPSGTDSSLTAMTNTTSQYFALNNTN